MCVSQCVCVSLSVCVCLSWCVYICVPANLENPAVSTGLEKSVFIPNPKKGNAKECSNSSQNYRVRNLPGSVYEAFISVAQSCPTLCDPMDCSTSGFPVHHQLPELAQTHVHRVGDAIQLSHSLSFPSPPPFNLSQHEGLFKWVSSLHQVAEVLEYQHQSFQWIFRTDFL